MRQEDRGLLKKALEDKLMVVVYRDDIGGTYYGGIPVLLSGELVVLAREREFDLDGYVVLRLRDITLVEQYDDNDFCRRVLEGEGVYQRASLPKLRDCSTMARVLEGVAQGYRGWLSVECESPEDTLFYVGVVESVDAAVLGLYRVDADGSWHDRPATLPLEDITCITFGGHYLAVYQQYTKNPFDRRDRKDGR